MSAILPFAVNCCAVAFCDSPVSVSVPGPIGPAGPPGETIAGMVGWFKKPTLAEARAVPALSTNEMMFMLGGAAEFDTFGAEFGWDNASTAIDDYTITGGSTINPNGNSGPGRWIRFQ